MEMFLFIFLLFLFTMKFWNQQVGIEYSNNDKPNKKL